MFRSWRCLASLFVILAAIGCDDPPESSLDGSVMCAASSECDDGLFCNGRETCAPMDPGADPAGCLPGAPPCMGSERCDEDGDRCVVDCSAGGDGDGDGRIAIGCGGDDCDDADPNRFPGNSEVCDDLGHDEDCDATTFGTRDRDGDGHVDALCCNTLPDETSRCGTDCNDGRIDVRPGWPESCDDLDNDCDGMTDEGVAVSGFADLDYDLHGDPGAPITGCPGVPGVALTSDDCDDANPARHGAQVEVCDGIDNDCDLVVDESPASTTWYADNDGDGFGSAESGTQISCIPPAGHSLLPNDCDDTERGVNPAATELCNGRDDNCSGRADYSLGNGDTEDDDLDGQADMACGGPDCDDGDATVGSGMAELCDGIDNDCDGVVDGADAMASWYLDLDGDGFGDTSAGSIESCEPQPGRVLRGGDCDDASGLIHPGVRDGCDGVDDDCDGEFDETSPRIAYYTDEDGDGFGVSGTPTLSCEPPSGFADLPGDCDDMEATTYPTANEICNGEDSDCDTTVDEESDLTYYPDGDGDGRGRDDPGSAIMTCLPPGGYVLSSDDCDDTDDATFTGAPEICDGADNDCDGMVDDGADAGCGVPNGTGACMSGGCVVASCDTNFGDCDASFATGCETDTRTSAEHCSACFSACSLGDTCGVTTPSTCDGAPIVALTGANESFMAIRQTGRVFGWGRNQEGQLGTGTTGAQCRPGGSAAPRLVTLQSGAFNGIGVTTGGQVWAWGRNNRGQLGATGPNAPGGVFVDLSGTAIDAAISVDHGCAVLEEPDGGGGTIRRVWCWGESTRGQLGFPGTGIEPPGPVVGIDDAQRVYTGSDFTCVLRGTLGVTAEVWCWGYQSGGRLGNGIIGGTVEPIPGPAGPLPSDLVEFARGGGDAATVCVRTASGRAYCWGNQWVGNGSGAVQPFPVAIGGFTDVLEVSIGTSDAGIRGIGCLRRRAGGDNEVWCWGENQFGGLGQGSTGAAIDSPLQVLTAAATPLTGVTAIASARRSACAATDDGRIHCWGYNSWCSLGQGTADLTPQPYAIPVVDLP